MLEAAGDTEGAKAVRQRLTEQNRQLRAYCEENGLKYRSDRVRTYGAVEPKKTLDKSGVLTNGNSGGIINNNDKIIAGVRRSSTLEIGKAVNANPNYSKGGAYKVNCQRCVQAYELRRRGYDIIAKPKPQKDNLVYWGSECFISPSEDAMSAYTLNLTADDVKKELAAAPDGARYSIYVQWKKRKNAHVFIAEKTNGNIRYIDPQTGSLDASSYFSLGKTKGFGFFRLDDKDILASNDVINQTVEKA